MVRRDEKWVEERLNKNSNNDLRICCQCGFTGQGEIDIVILDRQRGLLTVLEVKEWDYSSLQNTEKSQDYWEVKPHGRRRSPVKQAQDATLALIDRLPKDLKPGSSRLIYIFGVVFSNLSKAEAEALGILSDERLLPKICPSLWREDLDSDNPGKAFFRTIDNALKSRNFKHRVMNGRLHDRIWKRIDKNQHAGAKITARRMTTKRELRDLDPALRNLFERTKRGHHRVNGVVGSGKTTLIAHKALSFAKENYLQTNLINQASKPVLVVCFTRSGASKIRNDIDLLARKSYPELSQNWPKFIEVVNFHRFVARHYQVRDAEDFVRSQQDFRPASSYQCILVDEFQDFKPLWGRFITKHLEESDNSLLLLTFDPAQASRLADLAQRFDEIIQVLKENGIQGPSWKGRNFYIRTSHRVPEKIGQLAMDVHTSLTRQDFEDAQGNSAEDLAKIIHRASRPTFKASGGDVIVVPADCGNLEEECMQVFECVEKILDDFDVSPGDIAVIVPPGGDGANRKEFAAKLREWGIRTILLEGQNAEYFHARGDRIVLSTPLRLKGLEIPVVVLPPSFFGYLEEERAAKESFYQAVTRATSVVALLGSGIPWELMRQAVEKIVK